MKTQRPASGKRPSQRSGNGHSPAVSETPTNEQSVRIAPAAGNGALPVRAAAPRSNGVAVAEPAVTYAPADETVEVAAYDDAAAAEDGTPVGPRSWLTLENGLYIIFIVAALITRFWDLGNKGLHHDESLHAVFSWRYYVNQGYIHSPMMHGPEQFHFIDLFYLLFGATDATARFASAACGVFIVMAPFLLRRQIGRWPALIASFLFLVSPTFMYFTRFAREDAIYAAMEMLFMVGLWRFIDERKPRDFYMACAGYGLMFTIKESAYLTTAVFGILLIGLFTWQVGRWLFVTFLAYGVAAGGMALIISKMPGVPKLPNIPAADPTPQNIQDFVSGLIGHPLIQVSVGITVLWLAVSGYMLWDQSKRIRNAALAEHDELEYEQARSETASSIATVARRTATTVDAETSAGEEEGITTVRLDGNGAHEDGASEDGYEEIEEPAPAPRTARRVVLRQEEVIPGMLERYQPGSLPYAVGYLLRNPQVLGIGLGVAALTYIALYTSMFSNINGLGTGMFGSIGYWLAQQDVRRGDQPWFYYMLMLPLYDILPLVFAFAGALLFGLRGLRSLLRRRDEQPDPEVIVPGATAGFNVGKRLEFAEFRPFAVLFAAFWGFGAFALYSYAGEKMPWLSIHMVQPLIFLAALFLGQLVTTMIRQRRERELAEQEFADDSTKTRAAAAAPWVAWGKPTSWMPFWSFLSIFAVMAALWAMNIAVRVAGTNYDNWWQLLVWPVAMLALIGFYVGWVGWSRALRYAALGVGVVLLLYTARSAIQLSFYNDDTPREMAVYVQTSPDVTRVMKQIDQLSVDQTSGKELKVMYDSQASWPFEWYFRDYKNKIFNPSGPTTAPANDVAVIVVDSKFYDQVQSHTAPQLNNYIGTKYVMRWWFPEETYRQFVPDRFDKVAEDGSHTKEPVGQAEGFLSTIFYTLGTPSEQGKLWKFLIWREPYAPLGSTDMAVFVRKDLYNRYNFLAQLNLPNYEDMAR